MASGLKSKIKHIEKDKTNLSIAHASESVVITLEDDIDISRGDMIVKCDNLPQTNNEADAIICWFNERPLKLSGKYLLKHTTHEVKCIIKDIQFKININLRSKDTADKNILMNDIAGIKIKTTKPLFFDSYAINRITGSFILIDEATNETMGAGMIQ